MANLFDLSVASSTKKAVSTTPEFSVLTSKGGLKLNEAASRLLNAPSGSHIVLISNYQDVKQAILMKDERLVAWAEENGCSIEDYPVSWGIALGYIERDTNGNPLQTAERLTNATKERYITEGKVDEEGNPVPDMVTKYKGSKFTAVGNASGFGIITGSDAQNWEPLGGNTEEIVVYKVSNDTFEVATGQVVDGEEEVITVYPLVEPTTKEKIVRG